MMVTILLVILQVQLIPNNGVLFFVWEPQNVAQSYDVRFYHEDSGTVQVWSDLSPSECRAIEPANNKQWCGFLVNGTPSPFLDVGIYVISVRWKMAGDIYSRWYESDADFNWKLDQKPNPCAPTNLTVACLQPRLIRLIPVKDKV